MSAWKEMSMTGKTVLITGGNRGLGRETAIQLAKRGARILLACRDQKTANETAEYIVRTTGNENILVKKLDLSSLKSVRAFARGILASESRLDVLINNAGCMSDELSLTEDGFETTLATNYLGHFLLTTMLLPLLKRSTPSRIIVLTSLLYIFGGVDLDDFSYKLGFGTMKSYCDSKLYLLLFVQELYQRLEGTGVTVNAVHPGIIMTDILHQVHWTLFIIFKIIQPFCSNIEQGAQTSVYLAVSNNVADVNGKYFWNCMELPVLPKARDQELACELWRVTEELCKLNKDEEAII